MVAAAPTSEPVEDVWLYYVNVPFTFNNYMHRLSRDVVYKNWLRSGTWQWHHRGRAERHAKDAAATSRSGASRLQPILLPVYTTPTQRGAWWRRRGCLCLNAGRARSCGMSASCLRRNQRTRPPPPVAGRSTLLGSWSSGVLAWHALRLVASCKACSIVLMHRWSWAAMLHGRVWSWQRALRGRLASVDLISGHHCSAAVTARSVYTHIMIHGTTGKYLAPAWPLRALPWRMPIKTWHLLAAAIPNIFHRQHCTKTRTS